MILCDVCWIILGKSDEYEDMLDDKRIQWLGELSICKECYERYCKIAYDNMISKVYKKNEN